MMRCLDTMTPQGELYQSRLRRYVTAMRRGSPIGCRAGRLGELTGTYAGFTLQSWPRFEIPFERPRQAPDFDRMPSCRNGLREDRLTQRLV